MNAPLVIGVGSPHGDDQAGWLVVDRLRELNYPADRLVRARHPMELLNVVHPELPCIISDACSGTDATGTVRCFHWPTDCVQYSRALGSHDLSLCDALALGRELFDSPLLAEVWTLQGECWSIDSPPCEIVRRAAEHVAHAIATAWQR